MSATPEVKVLWGHATRTMSWMIETPTRGREVIATASPTHFSVRDLDGLPLIEDIARDVMDVWMEIRIQGDPSTYATHRLKPPHMRDIEPLPAKDTK